MAHSLLYFIREFVEKCLIIKSVEQKNIDYLIWFEPLTFQTAIKREHYLLSYKIWDLCQAKSFVWLMSDTRLVFC